MIHEIIEANFWDLFRACVKLNIAFCLAAFYTAMVGCFIISVIGFVGGHLTRGKGK